MSDQATVPHQGSNLRERYESIEARRMAMLAYLGNGVASIFLLGFGIANLMQGNAGLAWFSLFHLGVTLGNIIAYRFQRSRAWAIFGFAYGLLALYTYLVATGGVNLTGPIWGFPMVAVAMSILGAHRGAMVIAAMFCITLLLFLAPIPGVTEYSTVFMVRFGAAFLALALFITLHEFARARSQAELIRLSEQIDRLSYTDTLTGLPNRRHMIDRLETENSRYQRHARPYALLYGDIDDFKVINDRFGHQSGDQALRAVADTLRAQLRQHDMVCRWGGEEFLALLPETDADVALEVAEKLRLAVADIAFSAGGTPHRLTMSFGVQAAVAEGSIDHFIHLADQKLYRAKQRGKNCTVAELDGERDMPGAAAATPGALPGRTATLRVAASRGGADTPGG